MTADPSAVWYMRLESGPRWRSSLLCLSASLRVCSLVPVQAKPARIPHMVDCARARRTLTYLLHLLKKWRAKL